MCQKGYTPLSDFFTTFGCREEVPGPHPYTKFHCSGFKNVGLQLQKSRKIAIFGINLPLWENFGGPEKKLNIGAQLQTFLYAITPSLFWKLHRFTAFPLLQTSSFKKRDKQTNKKHHTFSSTAGARPRIPNILGTVIDEVRPIFAPPNLFLSDQ